MMHLKGLFTGLPGAWPSSLSAEFCLIYLQSIERGTENVRRWRESEKKDAEGRKEGRKEGMSMSKILKDSSCMHPSILPSSLHSFNKYLLCPY